MTFYKPKSKALILFKEMIVDITLTYRPEHSTCVLLVAIIRGLLK